MDRFEHETLIVGCGFAGARATLEAFDAGLHDVVIVSKGEWRREATGTLLRCPRKATAA